MTRRERRSIALSGFVLIASAALGVAGAPAWSGAEGLRTLVDSPQPIAGVAQGSGRIVWITGDSDCLDAVHTRATGGGKTRTAGLSRDGCDAAQVSPAPLAAAGGRLLWGAFDVGGNNGYGRVVLGDPSDPDKRVIDSLDWVHMFWGDYLTDAAGAGHHLLYAVVEVVHEYGWADDACGPSPRCRFTVAGGGVYRVVGGRAVRIPGAPPALMLATSGGRFAFVRPSRRAGAGRAETVLVAERGGAVEVRDVRSGARIMQFSPRGRVIAIALSTRAVAALVHDGSRRVEIRNPVTGALRSVISVAPTATEIALDGEMLIVASGRAIGLARPGAAASTRLAPADLPLSLSVDRHRIVWAENPASGRGRVMMVPLPR